VFLQQKWLISWCLRHRQELFHAIHKKWILFCLQNRFLQSVCRIFFCINQRLSLWSLPGLIVSVRRRFGDNEKTTGSLPRQSPLPCPLVFRSPSVATMLPAVSTRGKNFTLASGSRQARCCGCRRQRLPWSFDHLKCDRIRTWMIQFYLSQNVFFTMHPRSIWSPDHCRPGGHIISHCSPGNVVTYPGKQKREICVFLV